jgi:hypothetical protein
MLRPLVALLVLVPLCFSQTLPSIRWIVEVDDSGADQLAGLGTDTQGNVYLAGTTRSPNFRVKDGAQSHLAGGSDLFVTKLDASGNVVYSTYFGGSGEDSATAMAVDPQGAVYVTGTTTSTDFPTTPGAYSRSVPAASAVTFVVKLAPDGAVAYATYLFNASSPAAAIAVDRAGSAYVTGLSYGGVVTTPGAYRTTCTCINVSPPFSFASFNDAFVARLDPTGSSLMFSTYLGAQVVPGAMALAADGSAYVAGAATGSGSDGVFLLNATGTSLLASATTGVAAQAIAVSPDGSVYLAGPAATFRASPGAFQADSGLAPTANAPQTAIVKLQPQLQGRLAGTYFGGAFGGGVRAMTVDGAGHVYVGGYTSPRSLPTRTPFVQGFGGVVTGYVAELSGDLSSLLFSSTFGDNETFSVRGLAIGANGNLVFGGATGSPSQNVWANSVVVADPPVLRIDAVEDAGTHFSDPVSDGQIIRVRGSGFGSAAQLWIGGEATTPLSIGPTEIVAIAPARLPNAAATVQVFSDGAASNTVTVALRVNAKAGSVGRIGAHRQRHVPIR